MSHSFRRASITLACSCAVFAIAGPSQAHFLWLKTIGQGDKPQAFLFFGETAQDEAYHMPERMANTEVWRRAPGGKRTKLELKPLETDDRIGLTAPLEADSPCVLEANQQYGVYGKSLLVYYAKHVRAKTADQLNAAGSSDDLKLEIVPKAKHGELTLTVLWNGKPLPDAKLSVAAGDAEAVEKTTGDDGRITFKPEGKGIVGVLANHLDKDQSGEADGEKYSGVLHYASLTFEQPKRSNAKSARENDDSDSEAGASSALAPLPEPVSSFGAAIADGWLYVYSGHTGEEHQHSAANLSKFFRRIKLDRGASGEWEELPMQTPLQSVALVARDDKLYRVGGLNARNATTDDDEDLHSVAEFAQFDPATGKWKALAPLPAPRSSHNAAVVGDKLYVVGGWHLHGESPGDWQIDALVYDFANPNAGWQKLPEPPFKRRALALGAWGDKLVAIGGMNEDGKVSQDVHIFDPPAGQWSPGPELPGAGMAGFGAAACGLNENVYVSDLRGIVYRLNDAGSDWEEAARLAQPRFFHQLLPAGDGRLLAIGGASRKGHLANSETIELGRQEKPGTETAQLSTGGAQ
jgi:uncharacterized GH25 family protein